MKFSFFLPHHHQAESGELSSPLSAPPPAPRMLTVSDAARIASRCQDTIRRAIAKGHLVATKPTGSRQWLISPANLQRWINGNSKKPQQLQVVDFDAEVERAVQQAQRGKGSAT